MAGSLSEEQEQTLQPVRPQRFPQMQVLAQMHGRYILAQDEQALYIIDQHAAQERVHFEEVEDRFAQPHPQMQTLLVPIVLEGSGAVVSRLPQINEVLAPMSIQLESFGQDTLICRQLPSWMSEIDEQAFLQDVIDLWKEGREVRAQDLQRHRLATIACHHSIRFNPGSVAGRNAAGDRTAGALPSALSLSSWPADVHHDHGKKADPGVSAMNKVLTIVGPTGVGKTELSLQLARRFQGEIVSGDAIQVFRGLDIGSGKVTAAERAGIAHHHLDILDPKERISVADFQQSARRDIDQILSRGHLPMLVGGPGCTSRQCFTIIHFCRRIPVISS